MKYRELTKDEARKEFLKLQEIDTINEDYFDFLDSDYKKIRKDILNIVPKPIEKNYKFDLMFGIRIYEYFSKKNFPDFNESIASNYDFWRYISIKVVPDIIIKRHGFVNTYFYEKNVRIYLPTLWWFIELSYQGDLESTYNCLERFSTDYILQFVERPGRDGMYVDVTRCIFKYLNNLPEDIINGEKGQQILIRRLLLQNTAQNYNFNLVVENKVDEYVIELFNKCGVEVSK